MTTWPEFISGQCPLRVSSASWNDPVLLVGGDDWSFQCTSPWRLTKGERLVGSFDELESDDRVARLVGRAVVRCRRLTNSFCADLELLFDDELALQVFVTSRLESWVLRLPEPPTLVPGPGLPDTIEPGA